MDRNWKQEIPSTVSPMIYLLFKPDNYYLICHLNHCQMLGPFIFNMSYSPAGMDGASRDKVLSQCMRFPTM